ERGENADGTHGRADAVPRALTGWPGRRAGLGRSLSADSSHLGGPVAHAARLWHGLAELLGLPCGPPSHPRRSGPGCPLGLPGALGCGQLGEPRGLGLSAGEIAKLTVELVGVRDGGPARVGHDVSLWPASAG